ncbi:MAG: glycosyltransferase family 1 protein [Planctomycetota bacterium]|nr:MAG: glycosyltransferase family 1 protein [Planctomycetota bacterium]REK47576.1 MAG: glycosyltransferase family 1 protein [Planctomycetota bacterium]
MTPTPTFESPFAPADVPVVVPAAPPAPSAGVATTRVLHLVNGEHYAGAEKVQDLLGLCLPEYGFDVTYACLKPDRFPRMRRAQEADLLEVRMGTRIDLRPSLRLAREIRERGLRIIHTHTPRAAMVGQLAARLAHVPLVHHVHGQTLVEVGRRGIRWLSAHVERLSLRRVARLIAVSESSAKYLREQGFPADRISIVPNGVPVPVVRRPETPPRDIWKIGTVALFRPRKGLEVLLEAIAALRAQGRPLRLCAIGSFETPEYEAHARSHAQRLGLAGAVDWIGFRHDVAAEMAQLDVMVLPSLLAEGLPMVVIEAMAAGVPVLGTEVAGIVDVIRHDDNGLLARPNDAASLAGQVERLMQGAVDWQSLRERALADHATHYSDRAMAAGVATVYREVIAQHRDARCRG